MTRKTEGIIKGMGTGLAAGIAAGIVGTALITKNGKSKKLMGKAAEKLGDVIENVQDMLS